MGRVDWIWSDKWSSFLEEVIELSIFSSGLIVLTGLIGDSRDSNIDFGEFFNG